jgi:hypothetical protein
MEHPSAYFCNRKDDRHIHKKRYKIIVNSATDRRNCLPYNFYVTFPVNIVETCYDRGIVCYRLVGLLTMSLATTDKRWHKFSLNEMKRQIT